MDFSFEKTHSAYMLFYERCDPNQKDQATDMSNAELNQELADWIWHDNIQFLHDKHIFDTTYFNFMWFICSNIPPSLPECKEVMLSNVKLGKIMFVFGSKWFSGWKDFNVVWLISYVFCHLKFTIKILITDKKKLIKQQQVEIVLTLPSFNLQQRLAKNDLLLWCFIG